MIYIDLCFKVFTDYSKFTDWQSSSAVCKSNNNSYLFGDVNLTDPNKACALIQGQPKSPVWLGIAKELYISTYGGKFNI